MERYLSKMSTDLKLRLQIAKCVKRHTDVTRLTYYKVLVNLRNSRMLLILTALFIILLRVNYSNAHSD